MNTKICIVGLGYVGLPIFLKLRNFFNVKGFDNNTKRVTSLKKGIDLNKEFSKKELLKNKKNFFLTNNIKDIEDCNFYIVAVPTPILKNNDPDLNIIKDACKKIGKILKKDDIVFFESTVYPGVSNNICRKILEKNSKLKNNKDFSIGYSPERINPGDSKHTIANINKIVAFSHTNQKKIILIKSIFKKISKKIIYTKDIEAAETAKVIENIQRDLNIGLFNEIYKVCEKLNIDFKETIKLASSKWNFIPYKPGLVGGHCLPVDPYYLAFIAKRNGLKMRILLAGRRVNNEMTAYVFKKILSKLKKNKINIKNSRILILGETYKPNVADQRNSLAQKIIQKLYRLNKKLKVYDPTLDNFYTEKKYRIKRLELSDEYDAIIQLVDHKVFYKKIQLYLKKNKNTFYYKLFD
ncbi:nucleotide sugar dehydrogenase [Candidatus Pelagibacter ubique]|nr:nucleotide sugar dehydrogenase [Candidatus Pelagibacter ubique]